MYVPLSDANHVEIFWVNAGSEFFGMFNVYLYYGNTGYQEFKGGIQNYVDRF